MDMRTIFDRLMSFDTVSSKPNIALMHYVRDLLADAGIEARLIPDPAGGKANLLQHTCGQGGVMLSGRRIAG
jgi:acetylornithine deacetylase